MSDAARPTPLGWLLLAWVWAYQQMVSPYCRPRCRLQPSCSAFAAAAVRQHGGIVGAWYTLRRLLRCQPFGPTGADPVPLGPVDHRKGAT